MYINTHQVRPTEKHIETKSGIGYIETPQKNSPVIHHSLFCDACWTISLFQPICTAPMVVMFAISQDPFSILWCWSWKHQAGLVSECWFVTALFCLIRIIIQDISLFAVDSGWIWLHWVVLDVSILEHWLAHESFQWCHITFQRLGNSSDHHMGCIKSYILTHAHVFSHRYASLLWKLNLAWGVFVDWFLTMVLVGICLEKITRNRNVIGFEFRVQ